MIPNNTIVPQQNFLILSRSVAKKQIIFQKKAAKNIFKKRVKKVLQKSEKKIDFFLKKSKKLWRNIFLLKLLFFATERESIKKFCCGTIVLLGNSEK
jgi:hypothetical protein